MQELINSYFDNIDNLSPESCARELQDALREVFIGLEQATITVVAKNQDGWQINEWVKKAILLYFRTHKSQLMADGLTHYYDKIPLQFSDVDSIALDKKMLRVVPHAIVRSGAYVGSNTVLMPSFINVGAYVGKKTMVDTWATIGSCAYIGDNVHISGGVGIGGVLEPLQARPTIIENNCFIGARSEIVEGVIVEEGAVLGMGVFIGQSTKIYDRESGEIHRGRVPAYSVVIPGSLPSSCGKYSLNCAVIVKKVDAQTRSKVGINELLRC